jgi:aconitate hydratase
VYLKDIWPTNQGNLPTSSTPRVTREAFQTKYADVFKGDEKWQGGGYRADSETYDWPAASTYVQNPPYFRGMSPRTGHHHRYHGARPCWRCWATWSRPTTSAPRAASRTPRRPGAT